MEKMKMENKLKELAQQKIAIAEYKAKVKDAETTLQQYQPFIHLQNMKDHLKEIEKEMDSLVGQIKNEIEKEFVHTGLENTKPYEGIHIKKYQQVRILDEVEAKEWAAENAPQTLTLKKAPFNKIAKVLELDFVEVYSEWRATIASDLSMYEELEND
jgi:hypothetical protein